VSNKQRISAAIFVVALLFVGFLVFGGGGEKVLTESVATALQPGDDGFSFPNFGSPASPEVFGVADMVDMFGATVCVDENVDPCTLLAEAAAWAQMVNQTRASGHCEGLVVQAASRFDAAADPVTGVLPNEGDVTHGIMRAFATQFLPEVQDDTASWTKKSLTEKLNALTKSFKDGKLDFTMGLYTAEGGHAVLPYAIEFPTPDRAIIRVYDSNWPGKNRYVSVDLISKTWSFSFSGTDPANDPCAWSGPAGDMDLTSMD